MSHKYWHRDFRCNGEGFTSSAEIIAFVEENFPDLRSFIYEWFGEEGKISMFTSGSTGTPKAIKLQREQMLNSAKATGNFFDLGKGTKALLCLPLGYIAGRMMLVRAMVLGWRITIVDPKTRITIPEYELYDFSAMVPLQVFNSLDQLSRIRTLIVGGGQMSDALITDITGLSTKIYATFGMTETITHVALRPMNMAASASFEEHVYTALPEIIFSLDNRDCLVIKAPLISDTEIVTNDLVELISETSFKWLGRYDHVINSGGIKLIPELIESKLNELMTCPFFVFGKKDDVFGERLTLIVEGDHVPDLLKDIILYQQKNEHSFSKYEVPKEIVFVESFQRTETGKVMRLETIKSLKI